MLFLRYLLAIFFSFLIHAVAFSSTPQKKLDIDLDATRKSSIAIQFSAPEKVQEAQKETKTAAKTEKPTQQKTATKAIASAPKELKKVTKKTTKKAPVKAVIKEIKTVKKEPQKSKKTTKTADKQELQKTENAVQQPPQKTNKPVVSSSAKQSAPKIIEEITFSARPTPIAYPSSAKRRNIEGVVLVEVWLDAQGKQTKQRIINSSGHQILDKAALKGVSQWRFSQQQSDGQAIAYRVQVPINFGLK